MTKHDCETYNIMNYTKFIVIIILVGYCLLSCTKDLSKVHSEINIPIYEHAYDIGKGGDSSINWKYVSYKVNIKAPAKEVVEFYKNKFISMNFEKYNGAGAGANKWESFNNKSGKWEEWVDGDKYPERFIATWCDSKKEKIIMLYLYYEYTYDEKDKNAWKNVLNVSCNVYQMSDFIKGEEEVNKEKKRLNEKKER